MCFFSCCGGSSSAGSLVAAPADRLNLTFGDEDEDSSSVDIYNKPLISKLKRGTLKDAEGEESVSKAFHETINLQDNAANKNLSVLFSVSRNTKFRVVGEGGEQTLEKVNGCWDCIKYYWSRRTKDKRNEQNKKIQAVFTATITALNDYLDSGEIDQESIIAHSIRYLFSENLSELSFKIFDRSAISQASALEQCLMPSVQEQREKLIGLLLQLNDDDKEEVNSVSFRQDLIYRIKTALLDLAEAEGTFSEHLGKELAYIGGAGSGGARRGFSRDEKTIFANKADDESVYGDNNPRKRAKIKKRFYKGPKALRGHSDAQGAELSFIQDHYGGYDVVPPTKDYWTTSKAFVGSVKHKRCSMQLWVDGAKDFKAVLKEAGIKQKSVWFHRRQTLKNHFQEEFNGCLVDLSNILPSSLFEWFGLADWEEENRDCHFENGLVKVYEVNPDSLTSRLLSEGETVEEGEVRSFVENLFSEDATTGQTHYQLLLQELFRGHKFEFTFKRNGSSATQTFLETLYPDLQVNWDDKDEDEDSVVKTLRTIFIKIDNDSSFPHAHESSFLGTRKKHFIEVLPPLNEPVSDPFKEHFDVGEQAAHFRFLDVMTFKLLKNAIPHSPSFIEFYMDPENRKLLQAWIMADPDKNVMVTCTKQDLIKINRDKTDSLKILTLVADESDSDSGCDDDDESFIPHMYTVTEEYYARHKVLEKLVPILAKNYTERARTIMKAHSKELKMIHSMVRTRKESREVLIAHLDSEEEGVALGPIFTTKKEQDFAAKLQEARKTREVQAYNLNCLGFMFFSTFSASDRKTREICVGLLCRTTFPLSKEQIRQIRKMLGHTAFQEVLARSIAKLEKEYSDGDDQLDSFSKRRRGKSGKSTKRENKHLRRLNKLKTKRETHLHLLKTFIQKSDDEYLYDNSSDSED